MLAAARPGLEARIEQFAEAKRAVVEGETTRIQLATSDVSRVRNKPAIPIT